MGAGLLLCLTLGLARLREGRKLALVDTLVILAVVALTGCGVLLPPAEAPDPDVATAPVRLQAQMVMAEVLLRILFGGLLIIYLGLTLRRPTELLGLWPLPSFQSFLKAVLATVVTVLVMTAANHAMYGLVWRIPMEASSDQPVMQAFIQSPDVNLRWAIVISSCLVTPLMEELTYRGIVYGLGRSIMGMKPAMLFSGAVFALVHGEALLLVPLFIMGLSLALMYQRTGTLWAPILMHAAFNLLNLLAMLA
jgi:membrane protease YdiL (CAAX protease family)